MGNMNSRDQLHHVQVPKDEEELRKQILPSGGEKESSSAFPASGSPHPLPPEKGRWGAQALTLPLHSCGQALLVTAVLTAVPLALVHGAVLVVSAGVGQVFADGSLEEPFAALTAVNPVVFAWKQATAIWGRTPHQGLSCQTPTHS